MDLAADFSFAKDSGEFTRWAPLLRYVAAINPEATRSQFVEAAVSAGYTQATASKQFYESRRFDQREYGFTLDAEGRLLGA